MLGSILIIKIYYIIFTVEDLKINLLIKRKSKYIKDLNYFNLNVISLNFSGYSVFFNFIFLTNYIIAGTDLKRRRFVLIRKTVVKLNLKNSEIILNWL